MASKPLYYDEIDRQRIFKAYDVLKTHLTLPPVVHIVGTNGKGSTGRMIAYLAWRNAVRNGKNREVHSDRFVVGHYSSPHILKFNERIWIDGADVSDEVLEAAHRKLFAILGRTRSEALSYFEYTTLLALVVFERCDLAVLEAGLGGEFDATNVCDKTLSVVTPIGYDHQAFLGDTIEAIAATKLRSMQTRALLAPQPYAQTLEVAKQIAAQKGAELFYVPKLSEVADDTAYQTLFEALLHKGWPHFLIQNALTAMHALDILHIDYDPSDLIDLKLFGRFYPWRENVRIDVGHNPLAAEAIVKALDEETVLIYNSLADKDYETVLRILAPKLKRVEIIPIESQRASDLDAITAAIEKTGLPYGMFQDRIDPNERYLVFGSFYTVEAFLKRLAQSV